MDTQKLLKLTDDNSIKLSLDLVKKSLSDNDYESCEKLEDINSIMKHLSNRYLAGSNSFEVLRDSLCGLTSLRQKKRFKGFLNGL